MNIYNTLYIFYYLYLNISYKYYIDINTQAYTHLSSMNMSNIILYNFCQNTRKDFCRFRQAYSQMYVEGKGYRIGKIILTLKNKMIGSLLYSNSNQDTVILSKGRDTDQWN